MKINFSDIFSVLLSCLATNSPVPELPYPVYNTSMKGMIITISGMEQSEKKRLKQMVERKAGFHSNAFHDGVTHLVAASTRTQKYEVAVEKEIPCILPKWVDEVWRVSHNELVTAVDPRFSIQMFSSAGDDCQCEQAQQGRQGLAEEDCGDAWRGV